MIYAYVGAKGGVGNTVTALLAASSAKRAGRDVVLVDLTGDFGVVLGTAPDLPGIAEWTAADELSLGAASALAVDVAPGVSLLPRGSGEIDDARLGTLWSLLAGKPRVNIIDAGRGRAALDRVAGPRVRRLLTMTCCYQALHRARDVVAEVDDVIVLTDTQRALGLADIEAALGRHADAVVAVDRSISRWADAGLLLDRCAKSARSLDAFL